MGPHVHNKTIANSRHNDPKVLGRSSLVSVLCSPSEIARLFTGSRGGGIDPPVTILVICKTREVVWSFVSSSFGSVIEAGGFLRCESVDIISDRVLTNLL